MTIKTPANWSANPSAEANLIIYNSPTTMYNSAAVTYSSIVIGDQADTEKLPADWNDA